MNFNLINRYAHHEPAGLEPSSQLLARHIEIIHGKRVLVVNYPADPFFLLVQQRLRQSWIAYYTFDYTKHIFARQSFSTAGLDADCLVFGPSYPRPQDLHDAAVIYLPKSHALLEMMLRMLAQSLVPDSQVFLVGENQSGIRSGKAVLDKIIGPAVKVEAARHCVLYRARLEIPAPPFNLDDWAITFQTRFQGHELAVISFPGVFSHGKLDEGTRLLLDSLEVPPGARVLDFGCGSGVIGAAAKVLQPDSVVDLVDSNALALEASRRTMLVNSLEANIRPTDIFSDVKNIYALILSNPPFHTGVQTDYRVVERFLAGATNHLERGGRLRIVANRFLKYPILIEKHFGRCKILAEDHSYRVYEAQL